MAGASFEVVARMDQALATVKKGTTQISDWVEKLGKNQVPWDEMLTGGLDPAAIVGSIAGLFATAVLATGEFQSQLQGAAADASSSFGDNLGAAGQAAMNLSSQTGVSAGDAASALAVLSAQWTDTGMQTTIATDASTLAAAGLGKASDIANKFSQVLKEFGVTDAPTAQIAMQELYTAARNSGMSFDDFMDVIIKNGPSLAANKVTIQDSANALAALATQSGQTAATASSAFSAIANAISPGNIQAKKLLETISPGIAQALKDGDIGQALTDLESGFSKGGLSAAIIGLQAGLSSEEIAAMTNSAHTDLAHIKDDMDALAGKEKVLGTNLDVPLTDIAKMNISFNKTWTDFLSYVSPAGDASIKFFTFLLDSADDFMKKLNEVGGLIKSLFPDMQTLAGGISSAQTQTTAFTQQEQALQEQHLQSMLKGQGGLDLSKINIGKMLGSVESNSDSQLLTKLLDALTTGNATETKSVSNELNLNIGTINSNSKPQDIESILYKALYSKYQTG